jgi:hypothetical protein
VYRPSPRGEASVRFEAAVVRSDSKYSPAGRPTPRRRGEHRAPRSARRRPAPAGSSPSTHLSKKRLKATDQWTNPPARCHSPLTCSRRQGE